MFGAPRSGWGFTIKPSRNYKVSGLTRERLDLLPDVFATGVAIALPWSTTATVVFVWLYLASLLPRLTLPGLRDAFLQPVSLAPTAFCSCSRRSAWHGRTSRWRSG